MLTDPNPDDPLVPEIAHVSPVPLRSSQYTLTSADVQDRPSTLRGHGERMDQEVSHTESVCELLLTQARYAT